MVDVGSDSVELFSKELRLSSWLCIISYSFELIFDGYVYDVEPTSTSSDTLKNV